VGRVVGEIVMAYRDDYRQFEKESIWTIPRAILLGGFLIAGVGTLGYVGGWFSETAKVAQDEFGPRALLTKYEWFKDASAALDQKLATIKVYQTKTSALRDDYKGQARSTWARDDREQLSIWESEVAGVKASYNELAAQYNSEMAKFNWRFANIGQLPQGALTPLPREFKPYTEE
jgi:hypothetical protein